LISITHFFLQDVVNKDNDISSKEKNDLVCFFIQYDL
jgi:hypothetical protein